MGQNIKGFQTRYFAGHSVHGKCLFQQADTCPDQVAAGWHPFLNLGMDPEGGGPGPGSIVGWQPGTPTALGSNKCASPSTIFTFSDEMGTSRASDWTYKLNKFRGKIPLGF